MELGIRYRSDIDGLRGVAVLFVLAFHGFPRILPGGFIGVDIFFVISGYLISSILFKGLLSDNFTIHGFYARRIKRIFPALVTVLAVTYAVGWFVLFQDEFRNLGKHVAGGVAFISNILLWRETGYFNDVAEHKPLLHLWSLGIEEQFYLLYPVMLCYAFRKGFATSRFLVLLLAISFGLSAYGTLIRPIATFFLPITRLWELLMGCAMAALEMERSSRLDGTPGTPASLSAMPDNEATRIFRNASACAGLALIVWGALFINRNDAFPGLWALCPTLGATVAISAGANSSINRWLLGNKLLVGVGLISFPLYLWHWPLLYFARIMSPSGLSTLTTSLTLAASGMLALLTYLWLEKPIRFGSLGGTRKVLLLCTCMTVLLAFGLFAMLGVLPSRLGTPSFTMDAPKDSEMWNYPFQDNFQLSSGFKNDAVIVRGKPQQAVLFIGDSHMQHYWPRIEFALESLQIQSRPVVLITANGSPALPNVNRLSPGYACDKFFDYAIQEALKPGVSTVVFSCFWENYFISGGADDCYRVGDHRKVPLRPGTPAADQVFSEFGQTIAMLSRLGKEVVVILPSPCNFAWSPKNAARIGMTADTELKKQITLAREDFESQISSVKKPLMEVVTANGGRMIDPLDYFEEEGFLNGKTSDGRFRYKDAHHFRPFYVRERATFLDPLLRIPAESGTINR